ncbi:hypothetical protein PhCBS80983_g03163 [Powellomyces hirtus]|uniref:Anaphase-promoting complex subunit 4 WD40 domain-containing protein n=1 Tax=Powellomyces hirtus TaxID=109895 RepID=A0A507E5L0_9FUNG|nr:WD40-repeat-containing domain protein [Powellomyces hirtus]TPX58378.1 hypothetical protein PhCBS80983_g03163 [Powellomyces hirtus]
MSFGSLNSSLATKDSEIQSAPTDTVSELRFSPKANYLAGSSWDNQTRIWEVASNGQSIPKAAIQHEAPVLCVDWAPDGSKVFSGGCDKAGRLLDLATGQSAQVAAHDAPIRSCRFIEGPGNSPLVVTGSWDKTMKFWDLRSQTPAHTYQLPDRCYVMDSYGPMLVVGTADRNLLIFSNSNLAAPFKTMPSPLKFQTRSLACMPTAVPTDMGFCLGTIEGRIQIQYIEDNKTPARSFSFKCHRKETEVYAVNSISFHPVYGTFASCGSDGTMNFWDGNSKQRLKGFNSVGAPITASAFNGDGSIFAYSIGYDWSKGYEQHKQGSKVAICLHSVNPMDVKPKPPAAKPTKRY